MPEETLKVKLVFDTKGITGALAGNIGGGGSGKGTGGSVSGGLGGSIDTKVKGWAKAFTIPITDVLSLIHKGINVLAGASPHIAASMKMFYTGLKMILIPIGEVVSYWLRPFLARFMRWGFKFFQDYQSGGFWEAFKNAMGGLGDMLFGEDSTFWEKLQKGLEIAATLIIAKAILGGLFSGGFFSGLATALGVTGLTAGKSGLLVPAILVLAAMKLGDALGFSSFDKALLSFIGVGAYFAGGLSMAIPFMLVSTGFLWTWNTMEFTTFEKAFLAAIGVGAYVVGGVIAVPVTILFTLAMAQGKKIGEAMIETNKELFPSITNDGTQVSDAGQFDQRVDLSKLDGAVVGTNEELEKDIDVKKGLWGDFVGWLGEAFTTEQNAALAPTKLGSAMTENFETELPKMADAAKENFVTGNASFIKASIDPSIVKVSALNDEVSSLNRTVTTTHVIKTVYEDG